MGKRWRLRTHDAACVAALERTARVPPVVAQLLAARGIDQPAAARTFLDCKLSGLREPQLLPGVGRAADLLHDAVCQKRRIFVYGDYDADGMTATAILFTCLRTLGATVSYFVPNRTVDGYGLSEEALRRLAERGAKTVVTVDCGIASVREADTARQLGLELIVTDHHEFADRLPAADAIVHPRLPGGNYPFGGLCGAGVALKLAWALCQRASGTQRVSAALRDFLVSAVGLAAIGTVADVVPLLDENRLIVRHGLRSLHDHPAPGVRALLRLTGLDKKPELSAEDIAFTLAPRLNAAGRLEQAPLGVELLETQDEKRAADLAEYLHELNSSRDSLDRKILHAAGSQIKDRFDPNSDSALVLAERGWHAGVIGIVAGRLAERHHRPVVMISLDDVGSRPGIGSARSVPGFNLHTALAACSEHLISHGGHAAAAGLKIEESRVESFRAHFCEHAAVEIREEDRQPGIDIDAEAPFSQLTLRTVEQIEHLAPFGHANPRPLLFACGVSLAGPPKRMGSGERHLTARLKHHGVSLRAVAFGQGDWADLLAQHDGAIDVAFRPALNRYNGRVSVELHLVDWRTSK